MKTLTKIEKMQRGAYGIIAKEILQSLPAKHQRSERWQDIASRIYFHGIDEKIFDREKGMGAGVVFLAVLDKLVADGMAVRIWDDAIEEHRYHG